MIHRYKSGDRVTLDMDEVEGVDRTSSKTGTIIEEQGGVRNEDKDSVYLIDWDEGRKSSVSGYWLRPFVDEYKSIW
jgi:hypothetical protein